MGGFCFLFLLTSDNKEEEKHFFWQNRKLNVKVEGTDAGAVAGQPAKQMKPQKGVAELETTTPDAVELPESEVHGGGVIELLKQGHFKGVADVRLRINFFDKLKSRDNQALQDSAEAGFQTFNESKEADTTPAGTRKISFYLSRGRSSHLRFDSKG